MQRNNWLNNVRSSGGAWSMELKFFCFFILYLKWCIGIHLKCGHDFGPGFKLLGFRVDVVIKHSSIGWKLDGFELGHPPLAEFHSVIDQLHSHRDTEGRRQVNTLKWLPLCFSPLHSSFGSVFDLHWCDYKPEDKFNRTTQTCTHNSWRVENERW